MHGLTVNILLCLWLMCVTCLHGEVVYLCFETSPPEAKLTCPKATKIKVVESLYVKSQWDACFYQYGAGDCAQKTDIGVECCGQNSCVVKAQKTYLAQCGFSTLLRIVYECVLDDVVLPCEPKKQPPNAPPVEQVVKPTRVRNPHKRPHRLIKNILSTDTASSQEVHDVSHHNVKQYSPRPSARPSRIRHQGDKVMEETGDAVPRPRPRRPRRRKSGSKNSTAYGLLGSGLVIIIILSGVLAVLWWKRKRDEKRRVATTSPRNLAIEHPTPKGAEDQPSLPGHNNKGFESDTIMVSVLPEAPPRRKRKRHFPSFLGVKEIRALKPHSSPRDSLRDYDGESLSDSGIEVPGANRNKRLSRPNTDTRPDSYSSDIERLQQNFITRDLRAKSITEI